jgi:hypothetical protein
MLSASLVGGAVPPPEPETGGSEGCGLFVSDIYSILLTSKPIERFTFLNVKFSSDH